MSNITTIGELRNKRVAREYLGELVKSSREFNFHYAPNFLRQCFIDAFEFLSNNSQLGCLLFGIDFSTIEPLQRNRFIFFDNTAKVKFYDDHPPTGEDLIEYHESTDSDLDKWFLQITSQPRSMLASAYTAVVAMPSREEYRNPFKDNPPKDLWYQYIDVIYPDKDQDLHVNIMLITFLVYTLQKEGVTYLDGEWQEDILTMNFIDADHAITVSVNRNIIEKMLSIFKRWDDEPIC